MLCHASNFSHVIFNLTLIYHLALGFKNLKNVAMYLYFLLATHLQEHSGQFPFEKVFYRNLYKIYYVNNITTYDYYMHRMCDSTLLLLFGTAAMLNWDISHWLLHTRTLTKYHLGSYKKKLWQAIPLNTNFSEIEYAHDLESMLFLSNAVINYDL